MHTAGLGSRLPAGLRQPQRNPAWLVSGSLKETLHPLINAYWLNGHTPSLFQGNFKNDAYLVCPLFLLGQPYKRCSSGMSPLPQQP